MCSIRSPEDPLIDWANKRGVEFGSIAYLGSHAGTKEGACMVGGSPLSSCDVFEVLVVLFQVFGITGLCMSRPMPRSTAWSSRGQVGSIVALFGLGIAGALCGRHDSEFALFAGGTMTVLLIGMTMGSGSIELAEPAAPSVTTEPELAG
jgi:hypothetical protein